MSFAKVKFYFMPHLSNLTRSKVDIFVNILNYVSQEKAQDGTEDAQEIEFTKSFAFLQHINGQLKSNFTWMYSKGIKKCFIKFKIKVHKL